MEDKVNKEVQAVAEEFATKLMSEFAPKPLNKVIAVTLRTIIDRRCIEIKEREEQVCDHTKTVEELNTLNDHLNKLFA